jgi:hypothetical protein
LTFSGCFEVSKESFVGYRPHHWTVVMEVDIVLPVEMKRSVVFMKGRQVRVFVRVSCAVLSAFVLVTTGCASKGSRHTSSSSSSSRGIVVSPLAAQVDDPKRLLSVNSLRIEKPVFLGVTKSTISEDGLLTIVREVANETLSMKVVDGAKGGGAADSVLKTEIVTMDELKGSAVGGTPARVAFRMAVYTGTNSQPVWQAQYAYQQEAMAENWLKLRERLGRDGSGAGWISAQEIFRRGVTQSLQDLNSRRDIQFQTERFGK